MENAKEEQHWSRLSSPDANLQPGPKMRLLGVGQNRSTQRYSLKQPAKDLPLIEAIREQTKDRKHRRYGYRRITEILQRLGWLVNHKRIYRLWLLEGFRLPKPKKKGKGKAKGCSANACDRFPAEYLDHIWSYDIVEDKLNNGRKVRILNVIDEFGKECLASDVGFSIKAHDVVEVLRYLFAVRGCPAYLRSGNLDTYDILVGSLQGTIQQYRTNALIGLSALAQLNPDNQMLNSNVLDLVRTNVQDKNPHVRAAVSLSENWARSAISKSCDLSLTILTPAKQYARKTARTVLTRHIPSERPPPGQSRKSRNGLRSNRSRSGDCSISLA